MAKGEMRLQCPQCYTLNPSDSQFCAKCGSSLGTDLETLSYTPQDRPTREESDTRFAPGSIFDGRYRIIEEIGRGGMGRVFKAEDTQLGITVALKIIRPRLSSDPRFVDQFKKEMLLARSISHESIIRIFDLGEAQGTKYISMEFIKGENLQEFLRASGTLAVETVIHMARQIGEALNVAHAKGIVHQDLKPSNIMVDRGGGIHVMDFGLAKALYAADDGTGKGSGTPQYMSPEQATGSRIGPASDIYSFGAVLYEMAAGRPVFETDTPADYRKKHVSEKPVPPDKINRRLPKPLVQIILKCLEKSAEARYQSIGDVLTDLDRVETEYRRPSLFAWLKKHWATSATAVLLAGLAALVYFVFIPPPGGSRRVTGIKASLAVVWLTNNTGLPALDYMRRNLTELLIADLLQSQLVRVTTGDRIYEILKSRNLLQAPAYSSEDLKKIGAQARADYVLQGTFAKSSDVFRINASLHRAKDMEPVRAFQEEGRETDVFAMIESLTRKIKEGLSLSAAAIAGDAHRDLKKITTASAEAFRYYVDGMQFFNEEKFEESIAALNKAVALDPEFAMAYLLMSNDYSYLQDNEAADRYLKKALSFLNRVPEREYYKIQANALAGTSPQEAIDLDLKLLSIYPDDIDTLLDLGSIYRNLERWPEAARQFERALELDDGQVLAYVNLATIYAAQGSYEKSVALLRPRLDQFAAYFRVHETLGLAYLCLHQFEPALAEARKARIVDPTDYEPAELEGMVHLIKGDAAAAETGFLEMTRSDNPFFQVCGRSWLAQLRLSQGRYGDLREAVRAALAQAQTGSVPPALRTAVRCWMHMLSGYERLRANDLPAAYDALNQALMFAQDTDRIDYVVPAMYFHGVLLARMKRFDEAATTAERLRAAVEKMSLTTYLRYYHGIMGEIAREKGDLASAVGEFEKALSLAPREHNKIEPLVVFFDSLASTQFEQGDWDKALSTCEAIAGLTVGRARWGDRYALNYYRLAKIHQARNEKIPAAAAFRRFLEIWSQADPGLPEVVDARDRLKALGN